MRRDAFKRLQQVAGVVFDRADAIAAEQIREKMHHGFAVFQHVGNAGGRARIVFQNHEIVFARADDVDTDNVAVDAARWIDADHFWHERAVLNDQLVRDKSRLQDFLTVVDVIHESVQGFDALFDAGFQAAPLGSVNNARQDIEGDQAFARVFAAVDSKSNS